MAENSKLPFQLNSSTSSLSVIQNELIVYRNGIFCRSHAKVEWGKWGTNPCHLPDFPDTIFSGTVYTTLNINIKFEDFIYEV